MNPYEQGANQFLIAFDKFSDFNKASSGSYGDAKKYNQSADFRRKKADFDQKNLSNKVSKVKAKRDKLNRRKSFNNLANSRTPVPTGSSAPMKVKVKKPKTMGRSAMKFLKRNKVGMGLAALGVGGAAMLN